MVRTGLIAAVRLRMKRRSIFRLSRNILGLSRVGSKA